MEEKQSNKKTTKQERAEIVKKALGTSLTGTKMPSKEVLTLTKKYIEGEIEIDELQKKILEKYQDGGER